jgi:hypothetical protein
VTLLVALLAARGAGAVGIAAGSSHSG